MLFFTAYYSFVYPRSQWLHFLSYLLLPFYLIYYLLRFFINQICGLFIPLKLDHMVSSSIKFCYYVVEPAYYNVRIGKLMDNVSIYLFKLFNFYSSNINLRLPVSLHSLRLFLGLMYLIYLIVLFFYDL